LNGVGGVKSLHWPNTLLLTLNLPLSPLECPQMSSVLRSMSPSTDQYLRFWGVRGNIPTPGQDFLRYGGNTACVELCIRGQRLIFDAGTGLKTLGTALIQETYSQTDPQPDSQPDPQAHSQPNQGISEQNGSPLKLHLFFTHSYWDRIQGFPFFKPAFSPNSEIHIYGAIAMNGASIKQRLMDQMTRPGFPVPLHAMKAQLTFFDLAPSAIMTIPTSEGPVEIETGVINSADSSLGYRVSWDDRVIVYATDVDTQAGHLNGVLLHLAQDADVLIYDVSHPYYCTQSDHHNSDRVGFQKRLWKSALELTEATQAKRLILFHHDPWCQDQDLDQIETELRLHCDRGFLAQEGMFLDLNCLEF
jgi:phosphoribosyl 1,2-cyclic phosphodiesterase